MRCQALGHLTSLTLGAPTIPDESVSLLRTGAVAVHCFVVRAWLQPSPSQTFTIC